MKKTILGLFLGMSVMGMAAESTNISFAESASGELNITAKVIAPLTVAQEKPMEFGDIVAGNGEKAEGQVSIAGAPQNYVTISFNNEVKISRADDKYSIPVTLSSNSDGKSVTLGGDGKLIETLTGEIDKNDTIHVGSYSGTVTVSVKYD